MPVASASISASGSRAIKAGASLVATACATSTASVSRRDIDLFQALRHQFHHQPDLFEREHEPARGFRLHLGLGGLESVAIAARLGLAKQRLCSLSAIVAATLAVGAKSMVEQIFGRCVHAVSQ